MTVNVKNMAAYVAALRSGEFRQGTGCLRQETMEPGTYGYCCLGVATELAIRDGVVFAPYVSWRLGANANEMAAECDLEHQGRPCSVWEHNGFLADEVRAWLGIQHENPLLTDADGVSYSAASWNDSFGASFDDIAGMFESGHLKEATVDADTQ